MAKATIWPATDAQSRKRGEQIGLEVEGMHNLANGNNMTIGHVLECVPHPDSDHLNVCKVEVKPGEDVYKRQG